MKIKQPAKEVEVCDFCHREDYLQRCSVCRRQFCLADEGTVPGSYGFTTLCRTCAAREDVQRVCKQHASEMTPIFERREAALRRLPKAR
ncbi:MAG: hypothetical protein ACYS8L_08470 [Planctomycetota bacterium]|jgi:hypothetical protein